MTKRFVTVILSMLLVWSNGLVGLAGEHVELHSALVQTEVTEATGKTPTITIRPVESTAPTKTEIPPSQEEKPEMTAENEAELTLSEVSETTIPREAAASNAEAHIVALESPINDGRIENNANDSLLLEMNDTAETPVLEEREAEPFIFVLRWEYDLEKEPFSEVIKLRADSDQGLSNVQLQWQVAKKPQAQLHETEEEWTNVENEKTSWLEISANIRMADWRWRLKVTQVDGTHSFTDGALLPGDFVVLLKEASEMEARTEGTVGETLLEITVDGQNIPLPTISFTTDSPENEIYIGSNVLLIAEIQNIQENMTTQWQFFDAALEEWLDVEGATRSEYSYIVDEVNCLYLWRLLVTLQKVDEVVADLTETARESESDSKLETEEVFSDEMNVEAEVAVAFESPAKDAETVFEPAEALESDTGNNDAKTPEMHIEP